MAVRRISLILFEAVELLPASDVGRLTLIGESSVKPFFFVWAGSNAPPAIEVSIRRQHDSG